MNKYYRETYIICKISTYYLQYLKYHKTFIYSTQYTIQNIIYTLLILLYVIHVILDICGLYWLYQTKPSVCHFFWSTSWSPITQTVKLPAVAKWCHPCWWPSHRHGHLLHPLPEPTKVPKWKLRCCQLNNCFIIVSTMVLHWKSTASQEAHFSWKGSTVRGQSWNYLFLPCGTLWNNPCSTKTAKRGGCPKKKKCQIEIKKNRPRELIDLISIRFWLGFRLDMSMCWHLMTPINSPLIDLNFDSQHNMSNLQLAS